MVTPILQAFASETLTIANTLIGPTAGLFPENTIYQNYLRAVFVVEGAAIRVTLDNTTPTSSVGMLFQVGDVVTIEGEKDVKSFKAVRATSTNASAYVTYFK